MQNFGCLFITGLFQHSKLHVFCVSNEGKQYTAKHKQQGVDASKDFTISVVIASSL